MGIKDKYRWSMYSLCEGMTCGLPKRQLNGETVLFLEEAPYELQEPLCRWLLVKRAEFPPGLPTIKGDRPDIDEMRTILTYSNPADYLVRIDSQDRPAVRWEAWEAFLVWMTDTLMVELAQLEK